MGLPRRGDFVAFCFFCIFLSARGASLSSKASPAEPPPASPNEPELMAIERSLQKASDQTRLAWATAEHIAMYDEQNKKYPPLIQAEIEKVKAAAETAAAEDEKVTQMVNASRTAAMQAAMESAQAFWDQRRNATLNAKASEVSPLEQKMADAAQEEAELRAARGAAEAAMPLHAELLRGQRSMAKKQRRFEELEASSEALATAAVEATAKAEQLRAAGQLAEADQATADSKSDLDRSASMAREAQKLREEFERLRSTVSEFHEASQAVADVGAARATMMLPPGRPFLSP